MRSFGELMTEQMTRHGLTQRALASVLKVRQPTLHSELRGKRPFPPKHIPTLRRAFSDATPAELAELETAALLTGGTPELQAFVVRLLDERAAKRPKRQPRAKR